MTLDEAKTKLKQLQEKMAAYDHALSLLYYDGVTVAPRGTAANRGQTMGVLSEELYKLTTGAQTVALLEYLDEHKAELDGKEQRMVFLLLKDIRRMQKIPMDEYIAHQKMIVEAEDVWHTAKEQSSFALFEPYLEQIFADARKFAGYCAPQMDPYDYWLNEYEEGLSKTRADEFFATLRGHIVPLLQKVCAAPQIDTAILQGIFPRSGRTRSAAV